MQPSESEIDRLFAIYQAGAYAKLEDEACRLVERYPDSGRAWKILGTALGVQGKDALSAMENAARYLPEDAVVQNNLGNALKSVGRFDDALRCYQRAIQLRPIYAEAYNNLGVLFKQRGETIRAIEKYDRALSINANYADAHFNLANALLEQNELPQAIEHFQAATRIQPNTVEYALGLITGLQHMGENAQAESTLQLLLAKHPENAVLWFQQGAFLAAREQLDGAREAYVQALKIEPDYAEAHHNLGNVLHAKGEVEQAIVHYRAAIRLQPRMDVSYNNLGNALLDHGEIDKAQLALRQAISLQPENSSYHANLGNALLREGRRSEALSCYRQSLKWDAENETALNSLGTLLMEQGDMAEALPAFRAAIALCPDYMAARSNLLFAMNFTLGQTPQSCLKEAQEFGRHARSLARTPFRAWNVIKSPAKLRVGVVSGDIKEHPVGYALENLLNQLGDRRIELFAYPTGTRKDALTHRLQGCFKAWQPICGMNDQQAAQQIYGDGIHVLLDLSGHTAHNRLPLFAWKPAPIQASWLGYFATTGMMEMDYVITSETAVPPSLSDQFSEKIWYLPDIWLCFTPPSEQLPISPLPAMRNGYVTFGCFQRMDKISDDLLTAWAAILRGSPQSRLLLANKQLADMRLKEEFLERLRSRGLDLARVDLQGPTETREQYFERYGAVDILLDSFPYPGVTTTCEALWMGIPTITLAGNSLLARQGMGVVIPAGLQDWVAQSEQEYIELALHKAADFSQLQLLRNGLRAQVAKSPVFDAPRFACEFESAMWGMWQAISL